MSSKLLLTILLVARAIAQTAAYPSAVATDSTLLVAVNNSTSVLRYAVGAGDTTLIFPPSATFVSNSVVTIGAEIIKLGAYTAATGTATGCTRGYDGTTAAAHNASAPAKALIVAAHHNNLRVEVEAIETALGANLSNIPGATSVASYSWSQVPGGSVIVGANSITLNPRPAGVAGTNTNHYLRLANGTGTAEVVLITGGTCTTSGTAACTIIFTAANTHSGAWTIGTATAGIQEATNATGSGLITIAGAITLYAPVTFATDIEIAGNGQTVAIVTLNSLTQDAFISKGAMYVHDLQVNSGGAYQTAGSAFKVPNGGVLKVFNVITHRLYNSVDATSVIAGAFVFVNSCSFYAQVNNAIIINSGSGLYSAAQINSVYADGAYAYGPGVVTLKTGTLATNGTAVTYTSGDNFATLIDGAGILINAVRYVIASHTNTTMVLTSTAGVQAGVAYSSIGQLLSPALFNFSGTIAGMTMTNLWMQAARVHLSFTATAAAPTNEIVIANAILDLDNPVDGQACLIATNNDLTYAGSNSLRLTGIYCNSPSYGFLVQYLPQFQVSESKFLHSSSIINNTGITCVSCADVTIQNNLFQTYGGLTASILLTGTGGTQRAKISGNTQTVISGADMTYFIQDGSVNSTDVYVTGGNTCFNCTNLFSTASAAGTSVVKGNYSSQGSTTIAQAASVALPSQDEDTLIVMSGAGAVNTITGFYTGRTFKMVTNGIISFTGGNIGTALTTAAGQLVTGVYDKTSAKWWLR